MQYHGWRNGVSVGAQQAFTTAETCGRATALAREAYDLKFAAQHGKLLTSSSADGRNLLQSRRAAAAEFLVL